MDFHHVSVLLGESVEALNVRPDGIYLDGTLGGAGHSYEIASRLTTGLLIGVDRDPKALAAAKERLAPFAAEHGFRFLALFVLLLGVVAQLADSVT